jgi:transcriptional regulator with XRE-family HTH domain
MFNGRTLKLLRVSRALTQKQVATKLSISQQAYSKMERHEWIEPKRIYEIMDILASNKKEFMEMQSLISEKH